MRMLLRVPVRQNQQIRMSARSVRALGVHTYLQSAFGRTRITRAMGRGQFRRTISPFSA